MAPNTIAGMAEHLASVVDDHALEIPYNGRTYLVQPPDMPRNRRCQELWEVRMLDGDAERTDAILAALGEDSMPGLTLGPDVVQQMNDDGVPEVVMHEAAALALAAWARGPRAVERLLEIRAEQREQAKTTTTKPASKAGTTKTRQTAKKRGA